MIIKGLGWNNNAVTHIFNVAADSFTIADMTIGEVFYHPIQVHSNPNDADHFTAHNVKFTDAKEQLLKVSGGGSLFADDGIVECCLFEFSAGIAFQYYTGGIDAHRAKDWMVRFNQFKGYSQSGWYFGGACDSFLERIIRHRRSQVIRLSTVTGG